MIQWIFSVYISFITLKIFWNVLLIHQLLQRSAEKKVLNCIERNAAANIP